MRHEKQYIATLIGRIGDSDWNLMEGSGEDVTLSSTELTVDDKSKDYPVVYSKEFVDVGTENNPIIVFEDQNNRLWILRDEDDADILQLKGYAWMLPLYIYDKPDEFVYYAVEAYDNEFPRKITKIGGELELQDYYDKNTTAVFNFDIYKVQVDNNLGEHPKLKELEAECIKE